MIHSSGAPDELVQAEARSIGGDAPDLTACDREPIHIPGAIQPHGILLVADLATREVIAGAGDIEGMLTPAWRGRSLDELLAQGLDEAIARADGAIAPVPLAPVPGRRSALDTILHLAGDRIVVELEPASAEPVSASAILAELDAAGTSFERASDLQSLCERAAVIFRKLTGFDRVMIYRFLDDGAGAVLAEDRDPALGSFLNHHFPASDIPRQARALYVRNRIRVIPDAGYVPAPLRPAAPEIAALDLSDAGLRSVSPIHVQYLRNMGVAASASISIVQDGLLWGLVACHNTRPRRLSQPLRQACAALAGGLSRQVRAKEEAEAYRDRLRLRSAEDAIIARFDPDIGFDNGVREQAGDLLRMLGADGFAFVRGVEINRAGACPNDAEIARVARWVATRTSGEPFATHILPSLYPEATAFAALASGLLAFTMPAEQPTTLLWFRAEQPQLIEWAGNPHKAVEVKPGEQLSPRASFEAWREEVRGLSRRWTLVDVEAASRLRRALIDARQRQRLRELNRELGLIIADKEMLIAQKDHLLREVNHRVQNSLQLVQSFLSMQARAAKDEQQALGPLEEAQRRVSAVALVHRRLYQADQVDATDLGRYLEDLVGDMRGSMGEQWASTLSLDLAPMLVSADRAVNVGLILTELVINAQKYAYNGAPGPVSIQLEQYRNQFRLIVADHGSGKTRSREGFGTRMMKAMVQRLDGAIEQLDNDPGLRVVVTAPIS